MIRQIVKNYAKHKMVKLPAKRVGNCKVGGWATTGS